MHFRLDHATCLRSLHLTPSNFQSGILERPLSSNALYLRPHLAYRFFPLGVIVEGLRTAGVDLKILPPAWKFELPLGKWH
jgi:hypothetical protein